MGILPSLLWLRFYLHKDCHPEPRAMIVKTFLLGILLAPLAVAAQWLFGASMNLLATSYAVGDSPAFFLWAAFVEEIVKFLVVYYLVLHDPNFDEPVDGMIYLITAALGFAAIENILVLFHNMGGGTEACILGLQNMWCVLGFRTVGATLLHTLSSGLLGYFLALSWFYHHHQKKFIWFGIAIATLTHFAFNYLLLNLSPFLGLASSTGLLIVLLILIAILFTKVRDRNPSKLSTQLPLG